MMKEEIEYLTNKIEGAEKLIEIYSEVQKNQHNKCFDRLIKTRRVEHLMFSRIRQILIEIECQEKCQRCKTEKGEEKHICPYEQDINDDEETLCNCCESCTNECSRDI